MSGAQTNEAAFNIGIAMAGAVSGGAYMAGVFDFLMEALNEWQKLKDDPRADVPRHDVFISAISGTSAGGITAALGLVALAGGIRSVEAPSVDPKSPPIRRVLPPLYDLWVKKLKLCGSREEPVDSRVPTEGLAPLNTGDIQPGRMPASLLNSEVVTRIARDSMSSIRPTGRKLAYFTAPTNLFLTHTNLDGIPYPIEFAEGGKYSMLMHEGRTHFAIDDLGSWPFPAECRWLETWNDLGTPVRLRNLGTLAGSPTDRPLAQPFEALTQATLTTSAFPFGFSARQIAADPATLRARAMPFEAGSFPETLKIKQQDLRSAGPEGKEAHFVCIDGGALNNEPFELVRWAIRNTNDRQNAHDPETADRAVILIAPFPPQSTSDFKELGKKVRDLSMGFIGRTLVPALLNHARFKATDLITAVDPKVYSRYLVSPSRPGAGGQPPLASSPLYAFAGFLDEQIREYDFQLGRRNCQQFLRRHLVSHPSNPVF
jgi:hypothetical protein